MERLLYGAAYYEEYLPVDRLEKDVEMMKAAGINVVRIAESTWSTCEPQDGVFDFSHVERVLDAMEQAGISVIIGTPTYAVPTWMVKAYPEVLATTKQGQGIYGARQIMDITNPVYLFYAERVIRKLMEHTAHRSCVIGFQLDNETKYYGTAGKNVQQGFVKYLREKFQDDLDAMNHEFGLDYWSNRINAWEDFPDVRGTINGSLGAEFEKYQRTLVDRFLEWQANEGAAQWLVPYQDFIPRFVACIDGHSDMSPYGAQEYFADYYLYNSDVTFDFGAENNMIIHSNVAEPWRVTLVDTGLNTMTGGRIKRIQKYVGNAPFMMTYGDGVSDIDINKLVQFHKEKGQLATLTAVHVGQRFGVLDIDKDTRNIRAFREKSQSDGSRISAGYMVLEPEVFDYIDGDETVFEREPLERLVADGQLNAYKHNGYWQCMDTQREKEQLERLWNSGNAPWKVWE